MTLSEVLANEELRRREFPVAREKIFLAHRRLLDAKVVTSLRADRTGRRYIRLSPHFYNTDAELDRALELL